MDHHIAHYTLVRLLPQVDAGEFANVGVVLACPKQGYFEFRLIRRYGRVTRFFEEFTGDLFLRVRREVEAELRHIRTHVGTGGARDQALVLQVLAKLILLQALALAVYFGAAALSIPLWVQSVRLWGLAHSWLMGMCAAVLVFASAFPLGAGDAGTFLWISALSGIALGR